jgi:hypothetical protein
MFDLQRVLRPGGFITICEVENILYEVDEPPYNTPAYQTFPNNLSASSLFRAAATNQGVDFEAIHHVHEWLEPSSPFWAKTAEKYGYVPLPDPSSPPPFNTPASISSSRTTVASRGFHSIHTQVVLLPTGTWHPDPAVQQVGSLISRAWMLAWRQLEPLLVENGMTPDEAGRVVGGCLEELRRMDMSAVAKYHMICGTKA